MGPYMYISFRWFAAVAAVLIVVTGARATTAPADTSKVELREVTVTGQSMTAVKDGLVANVSRRDRQGARDANGLLGRMTLPLVTIDPQTQQPRTLGGNAFSYYINGVPADQNDVKALRVRDIRQVKVLMDPTDPAYTGSSAVIDYVVVVPDGGGYVTADADKRFFRNEGDAALYAKYAKDAWSLMAYAKGEYQNLHGQHSRSTTLMDMYDPAPGQAPYLLQRDQWSRTDRERRRQYEGGLRWFYSPRGTGVGFTQVSAGLRRVDNPHDLQTLGLSYSSPDADVTLPSDIAAHSDNSQKAWSPYASLTFRRRLDKKNMVSLSAGLTAQQSERSSSYASTGLESPLLNASRENMWGYGATAIWYRAVAGEWLVMNLSSTGRFFRTHYYGTDRSLQRSQSLRHSLMITYPVSLPGKGWTLRPLASLQLMQDRVLPDAFSHRLTPDVELSINGRLSSRQSLNAKVGYTSVMASYTGLSDALQQTSEFQGLAGNPEPIYMKVLSANANYSWMASQTFSLGASVEWLHRIHDLVSGYFCHQGVMYDRLVDDGRLDRVTLSVQPALRLFDGRTRVQGYLKAQYLRHSGAYNLNFWDAEAMLTVRQDVGSRLTASVSCSPPWTKGMTLGDGRIYRGRTWRVILNASYQPMEDLTISLMAAPFFRYSRTGYRRDLPVYAQREQEWTPTRTVGVSVRYTVNFGRHTQRDFIYFEGSTDSSVR